MVDQCLIGAQIGVWFVAVITIILFISSVYFNSKFIHHRVKESDEKKRLPKLLFYPGLAFLVISSITLLLWCLTIIGICYVYYDKLLIIQLIALLFYIIIQLYLLWVVMYIKLYFVFRGSVYKLSKCTNVFFVILFIFLPLLMLIVLVVISRGYWSFSF
eukprot:537410_1